MAVNDPDLQDRTIEDFGRQWTAYPQLDAGWLTEDEFFSSITPPFVSRDQLRGKTVADIGSGSGAIVLQLLDAQPERIYAVEPSKAMLVLKRNTAHAAERIEYLNVPGSDLPPELELDYVFSVGVIHHIPDPLPTLRAAFHALKPGGCLLIWLYGREGNELYLFFANALRALTVKMPHRVLHLLAVALSPLLTLYISLCRFLPLPMRAYMRNVLVKLDAGQRRTTIYDQLNPHYTKYYRRAEGEALLAESGFTDIQIRHREGYSWTVFGRRPWGKLSATDPSREERR